MTAIRRPFRWWGLIGLMGYLLIGGGERTTSRTPESSPPNPQVRLRPELLQPITSPDLHFVQDLRGTDWPRPAKSPSRLDPYLETVVRAARADASERLESLQAEAPRHGFRWYDRRVMVYVWTDEGQAETVAQRLREVGGVKVRYAGRWGVEALIPLDRLGLLEALPGVRWVGPSLEMKAHAVVSEGLRVVGAPVWQALRRGAGERTPLRIGIVDIGFDQYQGLLGSELPPSDRVFTRNFREDGDFFATEHGTSVAEIIYDFLEGEDVEFYLAAIDTSAAIAQAVDWFMANGVVLYNGSIGNSVRAGNGQCCDEDYPKHQEALARGILPIISAGNEGDEHWIAPDFIDPDGDGYLNFSGGDERNCFVGASNTDVILEWYDWPASARDYDLYITTPDGFIVDSSTDPQTGSQPPFEIVRLSFLRGLAVLCAVIVRYSGPTGVPVELFISPNVGMEYMVPAYSIGSPADSPFVVAVGAVDWDTDRLAIYSSQGPTLDGRLKPDISAPTKVSTVSFRDPEFTGTSAAAPHVTGALALMIQKAFRLFPASGVYPILAPRSVDLGPPGPDTGYGVGRLYMLPR